MDTMKSRWMKYIIYFTLILNCECQLNKVDKICKQLSENVDINSSCEKVFVSYVCNIFKYEWAIRMFDATAKPPSGFMEGNFQFLGDFDECLAISDDVSLSYNGVNERKTVNGKYCLSEVHLTSNKALNSLLLENTIETQTRSGGVSASMAVKWGICIPDVCTAVELTQILNRTIDEIGVVKIIINEGLCQTKDTGPLITTGDILTIVGLSLFLLLLIICTAYDTYLHYTNSKSKHILFISFSLLTNGRKLFTYVDSPNQLKCIGGIRTISMAWVILGHGYVMRLMTPINNMAAIGTWYASPSSMFILGATVSVDTFFVLSGAVMVYVFSGTKVHHSGFFNIPMYYLHRYLRLTPAIAALIAVHVTIVKFFGSGPLWPMSDILLSDNCKEYWWSTLLYVQNYVNGAKECLGQSWYLSVDMQLFLLSPLILIPMKKFPGLVLIGVAFLSCCTMASSFYVAWSNKLNAFSIIDEKYMSEYYLMTHTRAGPWLIGIILGYYIYQVKNGKKEFKINTIILWALWILALGVMVAIVFAPHNLVEKDKENWGLNSAYIGFARHAWAIALCWVIFACVTGYGGPINAFLSLPIFQIMARLTYSMYLLHFSVLGVIMYSARDPSRFSNASELFIFWSNFMITFGLAVIWCLTFESPIMIIEKFLTKPRNRNNNKQDTPMPTNPTDHKIKI